MTMTSLLSHAYGMMSCQGLALYLDDWWPGFMMSYWYHIMCYDIRSSAMMSDHVIHDDISETYCFRTYLKHFVSGFIW